MAIFLNTAFIIFIEYTISTQYIVNITIILYCLTTGKQKNYTFSCDHNSLYSKHYDEMFLTWLHYDVTRKKNLPCRSNNLRQKKKFFTYCLEIILKLPLQQNHIPSRFFQGKTDSTIHEMSFFKFVWNASIHSLVHCQCPSTSTNRLWLL